MPRPAGLGSLLDIALDAHAPEPLFRQLYAELRQAILGGRLEVSGMDNGEARRLAQDLTAGAPLSVDIVDGPAE